MYRCVCGKYTNYGPLCIHCAMDHNFNDGVEDLEELEEAVEEILEKDQEED